MRSTCSITNRPPGSRSARISAGLTRKLDTSSSAQGRGKTGAPPEPRAISLHEKRPPGLSTRATSRPSPSLSAMFIVTAYDQTWSKVPSSKGNASAFAFSKLDPLCESATGSQGTCRFDEVGGEVDRRHPATAFSRQITRRATEAATDIEHIHAGLDARTLGMLPRCHDTAAVQLVERPQIAMAGPLWINAGGPERIVNPLYYRPISVVTLNHSLDVGHARLLFIVNAVWPHRRTIPDRPYPTIRCGP